MTLDGKTAIVMGASRADNMGQAIARRLQQAGAKVVVSGRSESELDRFAKETGAIAIPCDLTQKAQVQALFDTAIARLGAVDIAVNAGATGHYTAFEETSEEIIDEMLSTIFKGGFFFMQAAVGAMKERGGAIVTVTSAVASIMFENHAAYMGAKAGIEHVTRTVANEFGSYGIKANIVAPGLTKTPMTQEMITPAIEAAFAKEVPMGRINTVEDVANAVAFAVSDECFMSGQTLHVTGGLTLRRNPTAEEYMTAMQTGGK